MLTSLAAAAAIALCSGSMPADDLPRVAPSVPANGTVASLLASQAPAPAPEEVDPKAQQAGPRSGPGLLLLGSTMAGGTGCPWVRPELHEKQSDARAMEELKSRSKGSKTMTRILVGIGVAAAVGAASMISTSGGGNDQATGSARQALRGAAGPRGGGAAFVWKVGFR